MDGSLCFTQTIFVPLENFTTKNCIIRRFGFPNQESLDAGKAGIECRGEEHDVSLLWSVTSGKIMLMSNGQQICTGLKKGRIVEYTWQNKNGNTLKIVAHSTMPMSNRPGVRQYDLFIDGKSFFTLPKVYEIGLKGSVRDTRVPGVVADSQRSLMDASGNRSNTQSRSSMVYSESGRRLVAPASAEQEQNDLKKAIEASLKESRDHLVSKGRLDDQSLAASTLTNTVTDQLSPAKQYLPEENLINFLDATPAPAPNNAQALVPVQGQSQYQLDDPFGVNNPQPIYNPTPAPAVPPASVSAQTDEFAPQAPTYNDISSQILMGYSPSDPSAPHASPAQASANPFDDAIVPAQSQVPAYSVPAPTHDHFQEPQPQQIQMHQAPPAPAYQQQVDTYGGYSAQNPYQQQQPHPQPQSQQQIQYQQQSYGNYQM